MTSTLRPRLVISGADKAIDYYVSALEARLLERHADPAGRIVYAELAVGEARFTVKDEDDTDPATPVILMLDVPDVDAAADRMVAHGGTVVFPVADHGYGRMGRIADPFGHRWILRQHKVDIWALTDLRTPWCIHVVATLRIAEHIEAGTGELTALAAATGCDARALGAVLAHLVNRGLFTEPQPGVFALSNRALLDSAHFLDLNGIGGRMAQVWSTLPTYVRTGRPGYHELFGRPFWDDLAANPDVAASFDALMGPAGHGVPDADFELAEGWAGIRSIVDIGGGTGALLAEILRARPGVRGILVDLPGTVARAAAMFEAAGVAERVTVCGQSFFDPLPAGADLYVLSKVLNDWPDEETVAILRRCAEAAAPNGRILVAGGVSPDEAGRDLQIEMLLLGGTTNTLSEFHALAARAGLEVTAASRQKSGRYTVECRTVA